MKLAADARVEDAGLEAGADPDAEVLGDVGGGRVGDLGGVAEDGEVALRAAEGDPGAEGGAVVAVVLPLLAVAVITLMTPIAALGP